ncbi:hypothetical protein MVEN_01994000 [Mycena venus]|uniref:Uncharacterized protein n=1 Tax=Mycena venus TaxID=2733690 RepID=A0A8H6XD67_9AGAR|nr:hypothetical protein MVEN_01994000 [Mycena venus]
MSLLDSTPATYPVSLPPPRPSSSSSSPSGTATPWTYVEPASQTPRTDVKDLPLPPPVLQPLRKHETTGKAPPPRRRREPPPQGLGWLVVIPGMIVALLSVGLATTLFLYLAIRRDGDAPSFVHGFYVDEMTNAGSPLLGLLASTVITNIVWLLGCPILISMAAYCVAGSWLSYQQHPRSQRPNLLTPLQYGLLFKLFSAPGPGSAYQVGSYIANRRSRVGTPAFFTTAFLLVSGVLGISYLISVADIWLHAVSAVVIMNPPSPAPSTHDFNDSPGPMPPPPLRLCGHYPLAPALIYLTLLYIYALLSIALTLWTATTWPSPPAPTAIRLAHLHLTDALAPIAARLSARRAAHPALGRLGPGLFVEDVNTARVEVGVWARDGERRRWGDTTGDRVFGVYKKVVAYKGEIY